MNTKHELKRYKLTAIHEQGAGTILYTDESPDGEWVRVEDVERLQKAADVALSAFVSITNAESPRDMHDTADETAKLIRRMLSK